MIEDSCTMEKKKVVLGVILVVIIGSALFLAAEELIIPEEEDGGLNGGGKNGGDDTGSDLGTGTVTFKQFPVNLGLVDEWWPLGHLNPPGHTFPTPHTYIFFPSCNTTIHAPADGKVTNIYGEDHSDCEVYINHTQTFTSLFGHIDISESGISEGDTLNAGDPIGVAAESPVPGIDWGVINGNHTNNFIHPEYYANSSEMVHGVAPFNYFNDSMQATLDDYIPKTTEPIGGKFDYDQAGKLVGNWFVEGHISISVLHAEKHLSFAYDMANDSELRIGVGGTLNCTTTVWAVDSGPDPSKVTAEDAAVVYHLSGTHEMGQTDLSATLLVEVLNGSEESIKVEAWDGFVKNPTFKTPTFYER